MSWFRQLRASQFEDSRSRANLPGFENSFGQLMKVISSSQISGQDARFIYTVAKQIVDGSAPYLPAASDDVTQHQALSVSELSNATNYYSYGVLKTNIPAGFTAKVIPNGTFVWCVPHKCDDGKFFWLIVNTQAIDGIC